MPSTEYLLNKLVLVGSELLAVCYKLKSDINVQLLFITQEQIETH